MRRDTLLVFFIQSRRRTHVHVLWRRRLSFFAND